MLIDEIHTPDSSRYFYRDGYEERLKRESMHQSNYLKNLFASGSFKMVQGKEGQQIPEMSDEKILEISNRYIELYEQITGITFVKGDTSNVLARIENNVTIFKITLG